MNAVRWCWWTLLAGVWLGFSCAAIGELEILETELLTSGTMRIVFEDTDPPAPYVVQVFRPEQPGLALPWYSMECTERALFEVQVPEVAADPRLFRIHLAPGSHLPLIISSSPAYGELDVSPELTVATVTFNRPMSGTASVEADANWGASCILWSADHRTVEIHRLSGADPLPSNTTLRLSLNMGDGGFEDESGIHLASFTLAFTTGILSSPGAHVLSSFPPSGAVDVDPFLDTVRFQFSEPMMPTGGFTSSGWWPWTLSWSEDLKTAYVSRGEAGKPLYGHSVMLKPFMFRAANGALMTTPYTLTFTTADPPMQRIEADPAKGFSWPYYLLVPPVIKSPKTLLVEPNNTGTWGDDPWFHEEAALELLRWRSSFAVELGCPLLVPVFPRPQNPPAPEPGGIYVHALDRYSLSDQWPGIEHVDLQLTAMIEDALDRLQAMGHSMDEQVFMMGFSASGAFTSRYAILHPEMLKAAACGSPGGWPMAPVGTWQGAALPYPFGVKDLSTVAGKSFNLNAFKQVALYIYVGGIDYNDALDFRGLTTADQDAIKLLLNYPADRLLANRWPLAEAIFDSVGAKATFTVYPGVSHTITDEMFDDLAAFFEAQR